MDVDALADTGDWLASAALEAVAEIDRLAAPEPSDAERCATDALGRCPACRKWGHRVPDTDGTENAAWECDCGERWLTPSDAAAFLARCRKYASLAAA